MLLRYWCVLGKQGIQEGYGTILLRLFSGKLDVWVQGVHMLDEVVPVG